MPERNVVKTIKEDKMSEAIQIDQSIWKFSWDDNCVMI